MEALGLLLSYMVPDSLEIPFTTAASHTVCKSSVVRLCTNTKLTQYFNALLKWHAVINSIL